MKIKHFKPIAVDGLTKTPAMLPLSGRSNLAGRYLYSTPFIFYNTHPFRLYMELYLQSLFGLRSRNFLPPPPLAFGLIYDGAIGQLR
jgi:hypothetical protein